MPKMLEYEAKDNFDGKWYPVNVLTGIIENGRVKVEWVYTGYINWIEPERIRLKHEKREEEKRNE